MIKNTSTIWYLISGAFIATTALFICINLTLVCNGGRSYHHNILLGFITECLSSPTGGIYTNYLDTSHSNNNLASGHEILSESIGLMMTYYLLRDDLDNFDRLHLYINDVFKRPDGLYKWRIHESKNLFEQSNASVDDLRIARAYYLGAEKWKQGVYFKEAVEISNALLSHSTLGSYLSNCRDETEKVYLSYLDLQTMFYLSEIDQAWETIGKNSLMIIEGGYLGDNFPFYAQAYDYEHEVYLPSEEVNMIDALLVVLYLSETGNVKDVTIRWLEQELTKGVIYGRYMEGKPSGNILFESTAVYALVSMIGLNMGNHFLINGAMNRMMLYQVDDQDSPCRGGFGVIDRMEFYSYDQLMALLAFQLTENYKEYGLVR